jgi:hypothetical protein
MNDVLHPYYRAAKEPFSSSNSAKPEVKNVEAG